MFIVLSALVLIEAPVEADAGPDPADEISCCLFKLFTLEPLPIRPGGGGGGCTPVLYMLWYGSI